MSAPENPPSLRASDADRDRTIDVLRGAVSDGRLDPAEFDERLTAALTARTMEALSALTADLGASPAVSPPAVPVPDRLTIRERHGSVRREGPWTLPRRLEVRTAWSGVLLDLTSAVRGASELVIELKVSGGAIELLLAPGMEVDANELSARHSAVSIDRAPGDNVPETLRVRVVGRIKHGHLVARWQGRD
ncbi:DUF1707 domain-containing protein [Actinomadura logoneensis]|uniref:DUF1707 domain-containing protein n=1 Tax=Actinomadura logoneensis TaxID=2293572 RepID=A0A372JIT2_9ACTN|nr:DUF1707 domain-containing protein [Actinomadura logoneensis]RFU39923.1 DUF1707 domain-containing protein [Actinomadura logoneensis]